MNAAGAFIPRIERLKSSLETKEGMESREREHRFHYGTLQIAICLNFCIISKTIKKIDYIRRYNGKRRLKGH